MGVPKARRPEDGRVDDDESTASLSGGAQEYVQAAASASARRRWNLRVRGTGHRRVGVVWWSAVHNAVSLADTGGGVSSLAARTTMVAGWVDANPMPHRLLGYEGRHRKVASSSTPGWSGVGGVVDGRQCAEWAVVGVECPVVWKAEVRHRYRR
uniref:Uncharacterized protein n=1 Tax=Mycena chlorophos TaxID=658473 RepID=A0ABQ0M4K9_MYCCL|nr:predicted protein [Mycena chlorophos]